MRSHQIQLPLGRRDSAPALPYVAADRSERTRQVDAVLGRLQQLLGEIRRTEPAKLVTRHRQDDGE
jgi:hypothetical protein